MLLAERNLARGFACLQNSRRLLEDLQPTDSEAASAIVRLAEWIDVGYANAGFLRQIVARFPTDGRAAMSIRHYLEFRMAEGFLAMDAEDLDQAIALLDFVLKAESEICDPRLAAIAHFWKGRAHRKKGEYDTAMAHIAHGRQMMETIQDTKLAAVIQIQESWLQFQKAKGDEALRLLDDAKEKLIRTDDALSLGNIESAKGRIEQQAGKYNEALAHFDAAVVLYGNRDANHRNLARALVNAATVKRLIALQLRRRIDARAGKARSGRHIEASASVKPAHIEEPIALPVPGNIARYTQICNEALEQLKRAIAIYESHLYYGGIASALVTSGYLHLDSGNVELGAREGERAYQLAHDKSDHIHMARARTLQCIAENTRVDEQLGEDADVAVYANHARQYAEDAIRWAELTQNRRLAAEAHVARAMVYANDFFQQWEDAKRCVDQSAALLGSDDRDHVWEDLVAVKSRILRASSIDETLRAWSEGVIGDKTFQQVTEEFAEIVIPKVWMREGRKIMRVSQRLAISPKKVRRILRNVGLMK
jgi:tetratricopeptide (TPR) repeat protein